MGSGKGGGGGRARAGGGAGGAKVEAAARPTFDNLPLAENLPEGLQGWLTAYTGGYVDGLDFLDGMNAEELNGILRDWQQGKPFDPTNRRHLIAQRYKDELSAALDATRPYTKNNGELYRVINDKTIGKHGYGDSSIPRHGDVSNLFEEGTPIKFDDFLSTATTTNPSYKPYASQVGTTQDAPIRIHITSSYSGRSISSVSHFGDAEKEVLFKSGTTWLVTSKKWNAKRKTWDISMEQL